MSHRSTVPETRVDADQEATETCPVCGQPFADERAVALHLGEKHEASLTEGQRQRYEDALDAESDDLFLFHLKMVVGIGVLYLAIVVVYLIVL